MLLVVLLSGGQPYEQPVTLAYELLIVPEGSCIPVSRSCGGPRLLAVELNIGTLLQFGRARLESIFTKTCTMHAVDGGRLSVDSPV